MFLHILTPQNRKPQRYASAVPALNVRVLSELKMNIPYRKDVYSGFTREVYSDVLLYEKSAAGFWIKKKRDLILWDCEILLNLPIVLHRGDVYEWEMIEC